MKLNPQIKTIEIGIRELREVTVYPMSLADQLKLSDIIAAALADMKDKTVLDDNTGILLFLVGFIRTQAPVVLKMVLDEKEDPDVFMSQITNEQFVDFVKMLIEVNFEPIAKNLKSLLKKNETTTE